MIDEGLDRSTMEKKPQYLVLKRWTLSAGNSSIA